MTLTRINRDHWSWAGIWIVGTTAAVWSFSSLSSLAVLVGVTDTITAFGVAVHISWGLPITVDVLAVVASRVWLRGTAPPDAVRYAQRAAWAAIAASVFGNAYHGWLAGDGRIDSVIVSAVPAGVIGALVHLAVLASRTVTDPPVSGSDADDETATKGNPPQDETETVQEEVVDLRALNLVPPPAEDRAAELIAAGVGRKRLAKELDIPESQARRLLHEAKQA